MAPVRESMQGQLVAARRRLAGDRVVAEQLLAHEEERGLGAGEVERVEQRGGGVLVGAVVEREDGLARGVLDPFERGHPAPALQGVDVLAEARN